jgi:hypothetical protein
MRLATCDLRPATCDRYAGPMACLRRATSHLRPATCDLRLATGTQALWPACDLRSVRRPYGLHATCDLRLATCDRYAGPMACMRLATCDLRHVRRPYGGCRIRIDDQAVFAIGPRALWLACDWSASLMARMCLNNRRNRMQAIGPAYQAQNHRNCRKTENGSQQFSCRVY